MSVISGIPEILAIVAANNVVPGGFGGKGRFGDAVLAGTVEVVIGVDGLEFFIASQLVSGILFVVVSNVDVVIAFAPWIPDVLHIDVGERIRKGIIHDVVEINGFLDSQYVLSGLHEIPFILVIFVGGNSNRKQYADYRYCDKHFNH